MDQPATTSFFSRRLTSIDALRGMAALGVVLYHTNAIPGVDRRLFYGDAIDASMFFGKYGVWLFFVISGFCIHLQWVRARCTGTPALGFLTFWKRRVRRLYPPYLVTLVFYVGLRHHLGELPWTPLSFWKIGLHAVMMQNVDTRALAAMNNVYWTLAVEEQLYLLYFVFLAIRGRWGWRAALVAGFGARLAWFALAMALHRAYAVDIVVSQATATQWGVWILGALSVEAAAGLITLPSWTRNAFVAAASMAAAGAAAWAQYYWMPPGLWNNVIWLADEVVWGLAFFVIVNWMVGREVRWASHGAIPGAILWFARIGVFSYSLYLTHEIVEWRAWPVVAQSLKLSGHLLPQIVVMAIVTVASVLFARVFFVLFERPWLRRPAVDSGRTTPAPMPA